MLTKRHILNVARLLDQTGAPRPGFLHDEQSNLEGPRAAARSADMDDATGTRVYMDETTGKIVTAYPEEQAVDENGGE